MESLITNYQKTSAESSKNFRILVVFCKKFLSIKRLDGVYIRDSIQLFQVWLRNTEARILKSVQNIRAVYLAFPGAFPGGVGESSDSAEVLLGWLVQQAGADGIFTDHPDVVLQWRSDVSPDANTGPFQLLRRRRNAGGKEDAP